MEWFWIIVAAGGAGFTVKWWRDRQATRRAKAEELESVRRLASEDGTYLEEQLQRLDREIGGRVLDEETRIAHQPRSTPAGPRNASSSRSAKPRTSVRSPRLSPPGSMRSHV